MEYFQICGINKAFSIDSINLNWNRKKCSDKNNTFNKV